MRLRVVTLVLGGALLCGSLSLLSHFGSVVGDGGRLLLAFGGIVGFIAVVASAAADEGDAA